MKITKLDDDGRSVINECDGCGGHHEAQVKPIVDGKENEAWFECPMMAHPVMVKRGKPARA